MTTNFVNVFRHFGPNAEKVLLGKLGLKFGKEYFFEYDENYVSSFPNPSPPEICSRHTARTKLKISFLFS